MSPRLAPVLYVEDEEKNDVLLIKIAFRRAGIVHPLEIATDGKQAIQYLRALDGSSEPIHERPCLVLLDLNLPKVNGLEVLQAARQIPLLKELPIIIFTSSAQPADQEQASQLGATDYFVKPTTIEQIVNVVRELNHRWLANCG
jgi:two-component system, response regulator